MRDSFARDLAAVRLAGRLAVFRFFALTMLDVLRFGAAERLRPTPISILSTLPEGAPMRTLLTTELRNAWRSLRATPIVTAVAVLSLALGIGANTALFSILNGLVLKSLPVREPGALAILDGWRLDQSDLGSRSATARRRSRTGRSPGAPSASTSPSGVRSNRSTERGSAVACSTSSASPRSADA